MSKRSDKFAGSELILSGVGACLGQSNDKKKTPLVAIAYMTGNTARDVAFTFIEAPAKGKLYTPEDLLQAIADAEQVGHVTYLDASGRPKAVCLCRPGSGKITEIFKRDYETNHYVGRATETHAAQVKFCLDDENLSNIKPGKRVLAPCHSSPGSQYEEGSLAYAMVNAYNACLLTRVFEREELQLETKSKHRVKLEIRAQIPTFLEGDVLYIKPVFKGSENVIDHYLTEEFHYIDGENVFCRSYKITYSNHLNDYNLVRV